MGVICNFPPFLTKCWYQKYLGMPTDMEFYIGIESFYWIKSFKILDYLIIFNFKNSILPLFILKL
jgi:hypothetical protein